MEKNVNQCFGMFYMCLLHFEYITKVIWSWGGPRNPNRWSAGYKSSALVARLPQYFQAKAKIEPWIQCWVKEWCDWLILMISYVIPILVLQSIDWFKVKIQENPIFHGKIYMVSYNFSLKPILVLQFLMDSSGVFWARPRQKASTRICGRRKWHDKRCTESRPRHVPSWGWIKSIEGKPL